MLIIQFDLIFLVLYGIIDNKYSIDRNYRDIIVLAVLLLAGLVQLNKSGSETKYISNRSVLFIFGGKRLMESNNKNN